MEDSISNRASDVLHMLARSMKITEESLCLCGSGKLYKYCCGSKSNEEIAFLKKQFEDTVRYRDSQGGHISNIPQGIFLNLQRVLSSRLRCLYPKCDSKPVSCHLIAENILRTHFGGHCLESQLRDDLDHEAFSSTGIGIAGAMPVFCVEHDRIFFPIDRLDENLLQSPQNRFLLSFKAIAFSLRKIQILLGLDFQVELHRPFLISERLKGSPPSLIPIELDISRFQIQHMRFAWAMKNFQAAVDALQASNWEWFSYHERKVSGYDPIHFSSVVNPPHDLTGKRLNGDGTNIFMASNVLTAGDKQLLLLSAPNDGSSKAYGSLFQQLEKTDDETLVSIINNIMTFSSEKPLLPTSRLISPEDINRIASQKALLDRCLKADCDDVFKLYDPENSVSFFTN